MSSLNSVDVINNAVNGLFRNVVHLDRIISYWIGHKLQTVGIKKLTTWLLEQTFNGKIKFSIRDTTIRIFDTAGLDVPAEIYRDDQDMMCIVEYLQTDWPHFFKTKRECPGVTPVFFYEECLYDRDISLLIRPEMICARFVAIMLKTTRGTDAIFVDLEMYKMWDEMHAAVVNFMLSSTRIERDKFNPIFDIFNFGVHTIILQKWDHLVDILPPNTKYDEMSKNN